MLPIVSGEFGVVKDPEIRFTDNGSTWIKIRGAAKSRKRGPNGEWTDGDPLYIDIIVGNEGQGSKATHIVDSIAKGDTIIVTGNLKMRDYESNGQKRQDFQISADSIGVSTRYGTAKTERMSSSTADANIANAMEALGAEEVPF